MSTSSYGLQLYKVFIVENPEVRAKLQPVSWGQSQIVDASHLLVFANIVDVQENHRLPLIQANRLQVNPHQPMK